MKKLLLLFVLLPGVALGQELVDDRMWVLEADTTEVELLDDAQIRELADRELRAVMGRTPLAEEIGEAEVLMRSMPDGNPARKVTAYRVEIFSDNTSAARAKAYQAYAKFRELHPRIPTNERRDIRYDSPKYTVRVGMFLTEEEALALRGRLRGTFNAYIRQEQVPLSTFAGR